MADKIGPFDGVAYEWSMAEWYRMAPLWAPSGIVGSPASGISSGAFAVTASGLTATVAAAGQRAWADGTGYLPDSNKAIPVPANGNATLSRRDRIVLRRDLDAKTCAPVLLQGTASATPTAPPLTRISGGVFDVPICSFLTPPNNGTTLSSFVDERRWVDSGRSGDITIGDAYLALQTTIIGGTWIDLATVTATSTGGECVARISETAFNGASGADRTMDVRVICDGTSIGSFGGILMPLANLQSISRFAAWSSTPAAGSHTWKLQAQASASSAVVVQSALLTVVEKG